MFCKNCGKDLGDSSFCPDCDAQEKIPEYDAEVVGQNNQGYNQNANYSNTANPNFSGLNCPYCNSRNTTPITESDISGGGYNVGDGCCGYILFGPIGLLCGACGSDVKTTHRRYWVCGDCGRRFNG